MKPNVVSWYALLSPEEANNLTKLESFHFLIELKQPFQTLVSKINVHWIVFISIYVLDTDQSDHRFQIDNAPSLHGIHSAHVISRKLLSNGSTSNFVDFFLCNLSCESPFFFQGAILTILHDDRASLLDNDNG